MSEYDAAVFAAFSEEHVERLTGFKRSRLRYWERTGFFVPSLLTGDDNQTLRIYSFRDIVALRTLELLRVQNSVPLQQLRLVAERLEGTGTDKWIDTTLYVANRRVVFVRPDEENAEDAISGQYLLGIPLRKIMSDTRSGLDALRQRDGNELGRVVSLRKIAGGPVVAGTRIRVASVKRLAEDGYTHAEIVMEYPDLTETDILAALEYRRSVA